MLTQLGVLPTRGLIALCGPTIAILVSKRLLAPQPPRLTHNLNTQHTHAHRCWTHETAILVNKRLPNALPTNDYREYYAPGVFGRWLH